MKKAQKYLVFGLGKTGFSLVRWLTAQGHSVDVFDTRSEPPFLDSVSGMSGVTIVNQMQAQQATYAKAYLSPGLPKSHALVRHVAAQATELSNDIALFRQYCHQPIMAVTGSNGKSSVVSMLHYALRQQGVEASVGGNIGKPVLELLEEPEQHSYCLELSSFQLESVGDYLAPEVACIVNLSADHMDRYQGFASYCDTKRTIYKGAKARVANHDDSNSLPDDGRVDLLFSNQHRGKDIVGVHHGSLYFHNQKLMDVDELQVVGQHNIANIAASVAILHAAGYSAAKMVHHLASYKGLAHRFAFVTRNKGVDYINDSKATNVGASLAALASCRDMGKKRLILIAGGDAKKADLSELIVEIQKQVDYLVLIGKDAAAFVKLLKGTVTTVQRDNMQEAVAACADFAQAGDIVLLSPACSSLDMYSSFEARGEDFSHLVQAL